MSPRPLALVLGLTAGDYLLWNWSLSGNHDVPALVSGLTLPPLAAASMLLLVTTALRLLARRTRRLGATQTSHAAEPKLTVRRVSRPGAQPDAPARTMHDRERVESAASEEEPQPVAAADDRRRPPRKLAA